MSELGFEQPQSSKYRVVEATINDDWHGERIVRSVEVSPEMLSGFETDTLPKEMVATILTHTMNGIRKHGASALGLDLASMRESLYAKDNIDTAIGVGSSILDELACRTDDMSWEEWIRGEFPNTIAELYGEDSDIYLIAKDVVSGDGSQTTWSP